MENQLKDPDETFDIELSDLYAANGKYTPEEKIEVVMCYFVTGSSPKASKLALSKGIKVPEATIRDWKTRSMWWPDVYHQCKKKKNEELDIRFSQFIDTAIDQIQDRVNGGDHVVTKDGDIVRKPIAGKDLTWMVGVLFDKRQMLRGEATSRTEKVTEADRLQNLEDKFKEMAGMSKEWNAKTIEGKVVDKE